MTPCGGLQMNGFGSEQSIVSRRLQAVCQLATGSMRD